MLHQLIGDQRIAELPGLPITPRSFADSVLEEAGEVRRGRARADQPHGRSRRARAGLPKACVMPAEFKAAYAQVRRRRLAAAARRAGVRRAGRAHRAGHGGGGVVGFGESRVQAVSDADAGRDRGASIAAARRSRKQKYLPKMVSGEWTGTMNLTEPQAGSDLAAIRTRAVPEGDHYRLFGQKIFITYGDHDYTPNIIHMVLARIDGAPAGRQGHFAVHRAEGAGERRWQRSASATTCAACPSSTSSAFTAARRACSPTAISEGAVGYLVGEANRGLEYMFIMMNAARLSVGPRRLCAGRARVSAGARVCAHSRAGPAGEQAGAGRQAAADCLSPRREAHAADDEGVYGRCSRHRALRSAAAGSRASIIPTADAQGQGAGARRPADSDRQRLVDRARRADDVARHPGARRHGLHRGDRRGAVLCAMRASRRSTKARPAFRRTIWSVARCHAMPASQ